MNILRSIAVILLFCTFWSCGDNHSAVEGSASGNISTDPLLHALNIAVSENQGDAKFLARRGEYYLGKGHIRLALQDAKEAAEIDERNFEAWFLLARSLFATDKYGEALEAAMHAERIKDNHAELTLLLAKLSLATGNTIKSDQYLFKASRMVPEHSDIYLLKGMTALTAKDTTKSLQILKNGLDKDGTNQGIIHELVKIYTASGNYDSAMVYVIAGQNNYPKDPFLHYVKGSLLAKSGLKESAFYSYMSSLKSDPYYLPANKKIGELYYKIGNLAGSKEYLEKVLEQDTALADVNFMLARVYEKQVQNKKAIELYKRILAVNAADTSVQNSLSRIYNRFPKLAPVVVPDTVIEEAPVISTSSGSAKSPAESIGSPAPAPKKEQVNVPENKKEVPLQGGQKLGKDAAKPVTKKDSVKPAVPKSIVAEPSIPAESAEPEKKPIVSAEPESPVHEVTENEISEQQSEKKKKGLFRKK